MKTVFSFLIATAAFFITTNSVNAQGYYHAPACNNNNNNGYGYGQPAYNNNAGYYQQPNNGYGYNQYPNNNYGRDRVDYDEHRIAKDKDRIRRDFFTGNVFALHQDHRDLERARRDAYYHDNRDRW